MQYDAFNFDTASLFRDAEHFGKVITVQLNHVRSTAVDSNFRRRISINGFSVVTYSV